MGVAQFLVEAGREPSLPDTPLAIVDLDATPGDATIDRLPVCPLIGIGDPTHPLAAALDAVAEPPVSIDALIAGITRAPRAAAAIVHFLRASEKIAVLDALAMESLAYGMLQGGVEHHAWLDARSPTVAQPAGDVAIDRDGAVLHIRLTRPWAGNAIDRSMRDGLYEAFTVAVLDPDIAEIVLTGEGRSFSLGADLAEFGTTRDPAEAHLIRMQTLPALALAGCAAALTVHVQCACVGAGLELAAFGQRITATADAWFQLPELAMGIMPGAGGSVSIPRRIGRRRAALMMLSGRRIGARTALDWGLIDAIAADENGADTV